MITENSTEIKDIFKNIVEKLSNYESRPQQIIMAEAINESFINDKSLIIEAGTGSGKSFGYLVPAVLSDLKIVISTGTIALQEQLMHKDIPFVVSQFDKEVKYTLAKGRSNYLCKQNFFEIQKTVPPNSKEGGLLKRIEHLLLKKWSGDIAELDFVVPKIIWQEISSDKDDCLNHRCEYFHNCPFRLARLELADSDIIVSNHALYLTDLASGGTILPPHDFVIFDEAHHIKNVATRAFTVTIGKWASTKLLQKIQKRINPVPTEISSSLASIETEILSWLFSKGKDTFRLFPDSNFYTLVSDEIYQIQKIRTWLNEIDVEQLDLFSDDNKIKKLSQKDNLVNQTSNLISRWEYFIEQDYTDNEDKRVNWAETNKNKLHFEVNSAPIFVSKILKNSLWEKKSAILTSATLAVNKEFAYVKNQLGLNSKDLILDSPFDYLKQTRLFLPKIKVEPNSKEFNSIISKSIIDLVNISQGKAMVLFTSISAMNDVSAVVMEHVSYPAKIQGDMPRHKLIEWFKETKNSILFATSTYWEGIDIPGEDLSCLIIDKIPFYTPDDPIVSAITDEIKSKNGSWFMEYTLPEATLKLKQGFGRLIRTKTDTGIICILDPRLTMKSYGQIIINSLPKTPITTTIEEVEDFFSSISFV